MKITDILVENTQQYKQMLQPLVDAGSLEDGEVSGIVNKFREVFQRKDRIVWALRWYRVGVLYKFWENANRSDDEDRKAVAKNLEKKVTKGLSTNWEYQIGRPEYLLNIAYDPQMRHLMSMMDEVPKMDAYQWTDQTPPLLVNDLHEIERGWKESRKQEVRTDDEDHPDFEILKNYGNQAWVLLDAAQCRLEGGAMGHCGNTAAARAGDRIISFRTIKSDTVQKPHLTFILDQNGLLGEMKGRANEKPNAKYHGVIVDLLKMDGINGIKGGGYAPENNFELSDLPEETQEELLELKPMLGGFEYAYNKGFLNDEQVEAHIQSIDWYEYTPLHTLDNIDMKIQEGGKVLLGTMNHDQLYDTVDNLADNLGHLNWLLTYVKGDYYPEIYYEGFEDGAERIYDELSTEQQKKIEQYILDNVDENIEDLDLDTFSGIKEAWNEFGLEGLEQAFRDAYFSGEENGIMNEMYQNFYNTLESWGINYNKEEQKFYWTVPLNSVVEFVTNFDEDNYYLNDEFVETFEMSDANQPYYGYSDFDEESAMERLKEELSQIGIDFDDTKNESIVRLKKLAGI